MDMYDAIVVGAGPAGGSCARELSKIGRSVLLLEQSSVMGVPNFSTAGTPNETMEAFGLPKKVTDSPWSSLLIAGERSRAEFVFGKTMGYVLNYKLLKQFLADESKRHGAEVVTGARVKDLVMDGGAVRGVKFLHDGETKEAGAKVVVDATGGRAEFSRKLGLVDLKGADVCVGMEYHMEKVSLERQGRLDFYLGPSYIPYGYAWVFPSGEESAKVGLCVLTKSKTKMDMSALLKKFAGTNSQTRGAVQTDVHGGSLFANGGIRNHVLDGFMAIGDAAVQINPIGGEGIRHAMYSGRFAAQTIDAVADNKRAAAKKDLEPYNKRWSDYVGNKWKVSAVLQKAVYGISANGRLIDSFVAQSSRLDPQTVFDILFNYKFGSLATRLPKLFIQNARTKIQ